MFRIEYDQRMIREWSSNFLNKKAYAHNVADRLQAQFHEHAYEFRTV
jgi:hypothetical protein